MQLFQFLGALSAKVTATNSKVHLAVHNGYQDPLDVWRQGNFEEWQAWQSKQNFSRRPYVVSLISFRGTPYWLFAGVFSQHGCRPDDDGWRYDLRRLRAYDSAVGRLVADYKRTARERQSYRNADSFDDRLLVHELLSGPLGLPPFTTYKAVDVDFPMLETIIAHAEPTWKTALSAVSGVYLISDIAAGKLYVGSADGEAGIWGRWCQYMDGHGGNVRLRAVLRERGAAHAKQFRFSILETADSAASHAQVLAREEHWKRVLMTAKHGYNGPSKEK